MKSRRSRIDGRRGSKHSKEVADMGRSISRGGIISGGEDSISDGGRIDK